jgi:transposase
MDFNIFFCRFGLDSHQFRNKTIEPVSADKNNIIYEVEEQAKKRICPYCQHEFMFVHDYNWVEIKLNSTIMVKEFLRIRKVRYKCKECGKTHTFDLQGIDRNATLSPYIETAIKREFLQIQSFKDISLRYGISLSQTLNIYDKYTKLTPKMPLPRYLCIDEKHFVGDNNGTYVVVLSDFFSGEVIDVINNRQMPYLNEYFQSISLQERKNVEVFISDMYDGYSTVKDRFFRKALFVVDLFHVIKLLTEAVKRIRIRTYNQFASEDTIEKHFMKANWKVFLCNQSKIRKNLYHSAKYDVSIPYGEIITNCLKLNQVFWDGYDLLQELLHYDKYESYAEANDFMEHIISKLRLTGDELLNKVADSYAKWKVGIVNGLARNQTGRRYSNAIAEGNNSHIQRIINVSYGYKSFRRLRSRIMLIRTYKNKG